MDRQKQFTPSVNVQAEKSMWVTRITQNKKFAICIHAFSLLKAFKVLVHTTLYTLAVVNTDYQHKYTCFSIGMLC